MRHSNLRTKVLVRQKNVPPKGHESKPREHGSDPGRLMLAVFSQHFQRWRKTYDFKKRIGKPSKRLGAASSKYSEAEAGENFIS